MTLKFGFRRFKTSHATEPVHLRTEQLLHKLLGMGEWILFNVQVIHVLLCWESNPEPKWPLYENYTAIKSHGFTVNDSQWQSTTIWWQHNYYCQCFLHKALLKLWKSWLTKLPLTTYKPASQSVCHNGCTGGSANDRSKSQWRIRGIEIWTTQLKLNQTAETRH